MEGHEPRTAVKINSSIYISDNGYVSSGPPDSEKQNGKEKMGSSTIEMLAESVSQSSIQIMIVTYVYSLVSLLL